MAAMVTPRGVGLRQHGSNILRPPGDENLPRLAEELRVAGAFFTRIVEQWNAALVDTLFLNIFTLGPEQLGEQQQGHADDHCDSGVGQQRVEFVISSY
mgnify:CR=1 FL=1